jgi:hypothetical protein
MKNFRGKEERDREESRRLLLLLLLHLHLLHQTGVYRAGGTVGHV